MSNAPFKNFASSELICEDFIAAHLDDFLKRLNCMYKRFIVEVIDPTDPIFDVYDTCTPSLTTLNGYTLLFSVVHGSYVIPLMDALEPYAY